MRIEWPEGLVQVWRGGLFQMHVPFLEGANWSEATLNRESAFSIQEDGGIGSNARTRATPK